MLHPLEGVNVSYMKGSFLSPFAQKRLKVNKCDLNSWVPRFMLLLLGRRRVRERLLLPPPLLVGHRPEQRQVVGAADEEARHAEHHQVLQERVWAVPQGSAGEGAAAEGDEGAPGWAEPRVEAPSEQLVHPRILPFTLKLAACLLRSCVVTFGLVSDFYIGKHWTQ